MGARKERKKGRRVRKNTIWRKYPSWKSYPSVQEWKIYNCLLASLAEGKGGKNYTFLSAFVTFSGRGERRRKEGYFLGRKVKGIFSETRKQGGKEKSFLEMENWRERMFSRIWIKGKTS